MSRITSASARSHSYATLCEAASHVPLLHLMSPTAVLNFFSMRDKRDVEVLAERANAKVRRVGSTKGIREELLKGREAVAMLNAVVSKQFVGDKTFLAAWRAAHRVTAKPGIARVPTSVSVSAPAAVVVPLTTPVVENVVKPEVQAAA
jgi:hypothetical protein